MEKLADDLFLDADADKDGTIQRKEFLNWAKSKIGAQVQSAEGEQVEIYRADVLTAFGMLPEAPARVVAPKVVTPPPTADENSATEAN